MRTCPRCAEENADRARFCSNCGEPLAEPEQRRRERKYATALFADLVGSTQLAEREDPEVVQSVVGEAFDRLSVEITRYEGLVEKFMGDAVLAVFGVPRAHEDDAERAVRAAIEMQAILSELNRDSAEAGRPQLAMRIGIESGEVLVDQDRVSGTRDRMLTGDAVNVAARLQSAAEPGRVVVGPGAFATTKDVIEYRELDALDLKGKAEPVPAWTALRVRAKQRGERPQLGIEARLVGRDEELTVLTQTFQRVQREGRPALVTVVGPAGVGKSRLVRELEHHVEGLPEFVYWRRGRCLAYGNVAYSALADAVKAQCEILEDDATDVASKKVDSVVRELFGDTAIAPQVYALVGAGEAGAFTRDELFEAWRRFFERMAARYPLTIVFEDIHWGDAGLLDFIEHVADWAQGPIMLIALARPELFDARPSWGGGKRNATSIYLEPLSDDESERMVAELLPGAESDDLVRAVTSRSEGNPLYVEEIVRKLIDDGILRATEDQRWEVAKPVAGVDLPRSIQALIATRIDVLPKAEKSLLQDASVVGRVFWAGAVAALGNQTAGEVREVLGRLRVKELVVPIDPPSFSEELEYAFRHALLRDGAYDSLPKSLRAEKHAQVAAWALERAGDRAEEIAELIATHDLQALAYAEELASQGAVPDELVTEAYRWTRAAGDRALALWLTAEAARWYRESLRIGDEARMPAVERAEIARSLTRASFGTETSEITERECRRALELFEETGDELGAGWSHAWLQLVLLLEGRIEEARIHGDRAVELLEPFGETRELAEALRVRGQFLWRMGDMVEAETDSRRAAALAERLGARAIKAAAIHDLGIELTQTGRTDEGLATMEEAFRLAKTAGDPLNLQRIYNNYASTLADYGSDYIGARAVAQEGLEMALRSGGTGWSAWVRGGLGEIDIALGYLRTGEELLRQALDDATAAGDEPLAATRHASLAWVALLRGRIAEAREELDRSAALFGGDFEPQAESMVWWIQAMIAAHEDRRTDALALLQRSVTSLDRYSVDQAPWVFVDLVRVSLDVDRRDVAIDARERLGSGRTPYSHACSRIADGLLADEPSSAVTQLEDAAGRLETIGLRIDLARVLLDLGRAQRSTGADASTTFGRALDLLVTCDAQLWIPEAEREVAG